MKILIIVACLVAAGVDAKFDICAEESNGRFFRDFTDCKRYVACLNGVSVIGSCPDQYLFNANSSICDYAQNVQCNSCPRSGMTTFAVDNSCRMYVRCISGHAEYMECPNDLYYDKSTGTCNFQSEVDCTERICVGNGQYTVASKEDCSVYYQCSRGQPTRMECKDGYYNSNTKACDSRDNVVCNIKPPRKELLTDVTVSCPPTGQHFYPHPTDCHHYYLCMHGVSAILDCGPALEYDIMTRTCNLPERAVCITKFK